MWDKEKIKSVLPQREPFLFVDEVIEVEEGKRVVAKKYIDPKADFFKGHFPQNPVMPGVLTIEAMAQTAIILYSTAKPEIAKKNPEYYLSNIKATLNSPVYPGETLIIEARIFKVVDAGGVIDATAKVEDIVIAKTRISFGVMTN
jgi:3-hydroxyacyl-[acyl-carrier-protein] dehydratase